MEESAAIDIAVGAESEGEGETRDMPDSSNASGSAEEPMPLPSLDLVFQLVREQYIGQQSYTGALDAKAGFILGSATLLTGVLAVWQAPGITDHSALAQLLGSSAQTVVKALPFVAVGVYLAVVFTAFIAYLPIGFVETPEPRQVVAKYLSNPELETKRVMLATTLEAFRINQRRLAIKAFWTLFAFGALLLEALVVAVLLIVGNLR